jgi:hypothetical protein
MHIAFIVIRENVYFGLKKKEISGVALMSLSLTDADIDSHGLFIFIGSERGLPSLCLIL